VIEFARSILGYKDAHSTEIDRSCKHKVVDIMENQKNVSNLGGTMRLGGYKCKIKEGTLAHKIYGQTEIIERHRHRFELNNEYLPELEKAGMIAAGVNEQTDLVEIVEIPLHTFFIATQFHPEFQSSVLKPHPLFMAFVKKVSEV
jgi:CTP synthase